MFSRVIMQKFSDLIPKIEEYLHEDCIDIYQHSFALVNEIKIIFCRFATRKVILVIGKGGMYEELEGKEVSHCKICSLSHHNRLIFNKYLEYTVPKAFGRNIATIGLGDRLGLASPAHIRSVAGRKIKPILAQQSKRELKLTGRTYEDVLDAACYAVMQEGYRGGYGADGDHLKEESDIKEALDSGYSMITLDCSEKINNNAEKYGPDELLKQYSQLPSQVKEYYEKNYLNKRQMIGQNLIELGQETLAREVLLYYKAIDFMEYVYNKYLLYYSKEIDFEISLDETEYPTTISGHFLVSNELQRRKINITSVAVRFIGEFQKGVDYIGNLKMFKDNFVNHVGIADYFGYKLSIHSGSDKLSVLSIIGECTCGRFHIKTSGTSWLEAVKVIIRKNPELYRTMHKYALLHFDEAKAYYYVNADPNLIKDIDYVSDSELMQFMEDKNVRQLIHITYGFLLNAKKNGESLIKNDFYTTLTGNEELYNEFLIQHIRKHLDLLGITSK